MGRLVGGKVRVQVPRAGCAGSSPARVDQQVQDGGVAEAGIDGDEAAVMEHFPAVIRDMVTN